MGRRDVGVNALRHFGDLLRRGETRVDEPFWPANPRFDALAPGTRAIEWLACAGLEQFERTFSHSSIFVDSGLNLDWLSQQAFASTEIERRRILRQARAGQRIEVPQRLCVAAGNDGLLYVCNRDGGRIQVYDKLGNLKRTIGVPWTPQTPPEGKPEQSGGAAVALDFSRDPAQKFMFVINQNNSQIEIMDRAAGKILSSFGRVGRYPGQFDQAHGIAVDSKNNIYVAENRGRRVQKFVAAQ
jgi:sugar lactone lactonase YvrE